MKRFYLVAALAATAMAAAFFTSCDKQDEVTPPQPESAALGFQSVVTAGLETRAAGDPTPLNASFKINLDTNDAYSTAVNNQEVKYTVGSGYSISSAIYPITSVSVLLHVYPNKIHFCILSGTMISPAGILLSHTFAAY